MGQGKIPVEQRSFTLIPGLKFLKTFNNQFNTSQKFVHTLSVQPGPY